MNEHLKVYLASPFFNDEQLEREERIKNKLRELGFDVFAPYERGKLNPDASNDERDRIFYENIVAIENCDIIFAITDGKDIGTIWEAGFACGLNRRRGGGSEKSRIKIVYYYSPLKSWLLLSH